MHTFQVESMDTAPLVPSSCMSLRMRSALHPVDGSERQMQPILAVSLTGLMACAVLIGSWLRRTWLGPHVGTAQAFGGQFMLSVALFELWPEALQLGEGALTDPPWRIAPLIGGAAAGWISMGLIHLIAHNFHWLLAQMQHQIASMRAQYFAGAHRRIDGTSSAEPNPDLMAGEQEAMTGVTLAIATFIHNVPEGAVLCGMLLHTGTLPVGFAIAVVLHDAIMGALITQNIPMGQTCVSVLILIIAGCYCRRLLVWGCFSRSIHQRRILLRRLHGTAARRIQVSNVLHRCG